jgi:nucleoside-diphosphate-sugar epimerase
VNILLTGSAGFIGSHLTERFLKEGHFVVGVDNYLSGQLKNTKRFLAHRNFHFVEADVSRMSFTEVLPSTLQGLDWVLHFASPASPPHYQRFPIETLSVGAQGTQHALDLAVLHGAQFMLASTSEVYGDPLVHPQPETYWGNVNPNGVRSCYDEAKRYAEALTMAYHRTHGTDTRIIRIFNTYGPYMRVDDGRVVTQFIGQALAGEPITIYGDGQQTRSFQFVSDLVEGIFRLMQIRHSQPLNLGNPVEYTILRFAELIREAINPNLPIRFVAAAEDDPRQRRPVIDQARALLGWEPVMALEEGIQRTVDYFRPILNGG